MKDHEHLSNAVTLSRVNRVLQRRVYELLLGRTLQARVGKTSGDPFRSRLRTEEGIEVDGFADFDLDQPARHLDFSRLTMPLDCLAEAVANGELLTRRFVRQVDQEMHIFLDVTPSMRFPLRSLYDNLPTDEDSPADEDATRGKPSLLKLLAGAFAETALAAGFTVRFVEFDGRKIVETSPFRNRLELPWLFRRIDRHFGKSTRSESPRPSNFLRRLLPRASEQTAAASTKTYGDVAARYMRQKAVAVFLGDFLEGAFDPEGNRSSASRRMVRLFRLWAQTRPLAVVRINHSFETTMRSATNLRHPHGDSCHMDVERPEYEPPSSHHTESLHNRRERLRCQHKWTEFFRPKLRKYCRGYAEIDQRRRLPEIARELTQTWRSLFQ